MNVSTTEWAITLGVTLAVLIFDVLFSVRRPHEPSRRECVVALSIYILLAVGFGLWVWNFHGGQFGHVGVDEVGHPAHHLAAALHAHGGPLGEGVHRGGDGGGGDPLVAAGHVGQLDGPVQRGAVLEGER